MTTKFKQSTGSKLNHPHMIIPSEDTEWAISQKPCVLRFWQQCWLADPFGSRWMKLVTNLSDSAFRLARRVLEAAGLFIFRRLSCGSDGRTSVWEVKNLHGARVKDFWQSEKNEADAASNKADNVSIRANTATIETNTATQTQPEQAFQEPSRTVQEHLTNSPKELVRCTSSTQKENTRVEETAIAPFGGASPQTLESVEEKEEELPAVTDCTSLVLVDATQSQSALLKGEKQDCRVEAIIPHEGTCSAAPTAPNFEEQAQHSFSTPLIDENQISGDDDKTLHVDQDSAASAPSAEKWSHQAIAARSKARPGRMQKLKLAEVLKENPGFEFLHECWNDDPALQIVIRKLLMKFPQWGIAMSGKVVYTPDGEAVNLQEMMDAAVSNAGVNNIFIKMPPF